MKKSDNKTQYKSLSTTHKYEKFVQVVEPIAPEAMAKKLVSFSVTVDSVVATATLIVDDSHKHLSLHWDDGQVEVINLSKLRHLSPRVGNNQEPNTLKIQHVYRAPFDYGSRFINAVAEDSEGRRSSDSIVVDIERRYRLSFYSIILEFPHHLDSSFESFSEIEARMYAKHGGTVFFDKSWKDDVLTAPQITTGAPITWRLNQSHFTRDISYSDAPIEIYFDMVEADGIGEEGGIWNTIWDVLTFPKYIFTLYPLSTNPAFDSYDLPNQIDEMPLKIHPETSLNSTVATCVFRMPSDRGVVFARFNYELNLIVPLDQGLERVMTTS